MSLVASGYAAMSCGAMPLISACASRRLDAVSQAAEHAQDAADVALLRLGRHERRPQIVVLSGNVMPSGMTPMIVAGVPLSADGPAEHLRIAAVAVLPEAVADDDDRLGARALVGRR